MLTLHLVLCLPTQYFYFSFGLFFSLFWCFVGTLTQTGLQPFSDPPLLILSGIPISFIIPESWLLIARTPGITWQQSFSNIRLQIFDIKQVSAYSLLACRCCYKISVVRCSVPSLLRLDHIWVTKLLNSCSFYLFAAMCEQVLHVGWWSNRKSIRSQSVYNPTVKIQHTELWV